MAIATRMQNPTTMSTRMGYEGFSWTCFFFGPVPALIRGDLLGFLAMVASALMTFGLSGFVWIFVYNRWHFNRLLAKGYEPAGYGVHFAPTMTVNLQSGLPEERAYEPRPVEFAPREPALSARVRSEPPKATPKMFGRRAGA